MATRTSKKTDPTTSSAAASGDVARARGSKAGAVSKASKRDAKLSKSITPSMAQFLEIKAANPDSILWYRMGDFYELFFEDAKIVSEALSITLTKRGKHLGEDVPMCGVPVVRADEYLHKLIKKGFRVAVCEQLEDPATARKRGSKSIVRRDVVRLVTPGTLTEDALLDARAGNFLCALRLAQGKDLKNGGGAAALASIDISTGEFEIGLIAISDLPGELVRLDPRELIVSDGMEPVADVDTILKMLGTAVSPVPEAHFNSLSGERDLKELFKIADLGAFGAFDRMELSAVSALLKYVDATQLGAKPFTRAPRRTGLGDVLLIDAASRASLEITRSVSGEKGTTLLASIDRTVSGPGARELCARLANPLRDVGRINARLDAVSFVFDNVSLRSDLRANLKACPDLARALSRLAFKRGTARDLANVRDAMACAGVCERLLGANSGAIGLPQDLEDLRSVFATVPAALLETLENALVSSPSANRREGGFIAPGYSQDLDEAVRLKRNGHQIMADLEAKYALETGVKSLKIRHNNILGYFIEVRQANAGELAREPFDKMFRQRQSIATASRFTTDELDDTQTRIATAAGQADDFEQEIFSNLSQMIGTAADVLGRVAAALSELDVTASMAEVAQQEDYSRPIVDDSRTFVIKGGRHPVVEQALRAAREVAFIENDCVLGVSKNFERSEGVEATSAPPGFDEDRDAYIWLVTGPNMAGKSTFLRQNALITILAQIGCFVPAHYAHIGVVDRLFSRVGASDDLARGRSTFMVEMVETASILNLASDRSLVILDEIGRGTATFDGLSIAWACVEYLHDVSGARTLFATHYHELTVLPERFSGVANVTIDVKEWRDEIIFLHKVRSGAADRSYGIQVGKLAGLPKAVVARASEVLAILEENDQRGGAASANSLDELPLFKSAIAPVRPIEDQEALQVVSKLDEMNPDNLTPREALEFLYQLKKLRLDDEQNN